MSPAGRRFLEVVRIDNDGFMLPGWSRVLGTFTRAELDYIRELVARSV